MSDVKLGQLAPENAERDAFHIAVAPVIAACDLNPGSHVGLDIDGTVGIFCNTIGIVDPFLTEKVKKGERFWLFLYQNTVTAMKHHWSHPSFPSEPEKKNTEKPKTNEHETWIKNYADELGIGHRELMSAADTWVNHEEYTLNNYMEGQGISDEFWDHYNALTGKSGTGSFFSCSC